MELHEFVNAWLARTGWSITRLAQTVGVGPSLMSRWLATDPRRRICPSPKNLEKLAPVLDVPYEDLMKMAGYLPGQAGVSAAADPTLAQVIALWPKLSAGVREAITLLVGAGSRVSDHSTPSYRRANGVSVSPPAFSDASRDTAEGTSGNAEDGPLSACKPALERPLTLPTVARPQFSPA